MRGIAGGTGQRGKRLARFAPEFLSALGIAVLLGAAAWNRMFGVPCRVEADCRGLEIDVEQMKEWEEQEKDVYDGILRMAGWRIEGRQTVTAVSTGRGEVAAVLAVYGSAPLACPAGLLAGNGELYRAEEGPGGPGCILTAELSDALFGSFDTAGERVRVGDDLLTVTGVIDREGCSLLRSADGGAIEYAAFWLPRRWQAEEKVRQMIGGG